MDQGGIRIKKVHFVDTSILLNLLDVPNKNADIDIVKEELKRIVIQGETLILPVASIIETGNHIAQASGGGQVRRTLAEKFAEFLIDTAKGNAPWKMSILNWDKETLLNFASQFPESAMKETGIGDLSGVSVRIWSMDKHLQGYDHNEQEIGRRNR